MTLRRRQPDVHDEEFASFVADVRDVLAESPGEDAARRHLSAMRLAAAEGTSTQGARPAPRAATPRPANRRARPALRLVGVAAGALIAFSGTSTVLAAVGVSLPEAVRAPFDVVGVDLPNQEGNEPPRGPGERAAPGDPGEPARDRGESAPGRTKKHGGRAAEKRANRGSARGRDGERGGSSNAGGAAGTERGRSAEAPGAERSGEVSKGQQGARRTRRARPQSKPVTPAPRRSARRGAGPARPIKPTTQAPRRRQQVAPDATPQTTTTPDTTGDPLP